jgi:hypothetical protein
MRTVNRLSLPDHFSTMFITHGFSGKVSAFSLCWQ